MKTALKIIIFGTLSAVMLFGHACSKSPTNNPSLREESPTRRGLRIGADYSHALEQTLFNSVVYVFSDRTVSIYKVVSKGQDICLRKANGEVVTSDLETASNLHYYRGLNGVGAPKGSVLSKGPQDDDPLEVIFGPGDRMPVLESAPYKIEGTSVYVDWSQCHSKYFELSHCNSQSEVLTVKNDGLVLESATSPGFNLTLNINGTPSGERH